MTATIDVISRWRRLAPAALMCCAGLASAARPDDDLVDACLHMRSNSKVSYTELTPSQTDISDEIEEEDDGRRTLTKKSTVARLGKQSFGVWESVPPNTRGVTYNGVDIDLKQVLRLKRGQSAALVDMQRVAFGSAHSNGRRYLCVTYNAGEAPHNRVFGSVRGLYLIENQVRAAKAYFIVADVGATGR